MRPHLVTGLVLVFACLIANQSAALVKHSVGVARSPDGSTTHYVEHHQYLEDGQHLVRYYDNDMNLIVEKELTYPSLPQHPEIRQTNLLSNEQSVSVISEGKATFEKNSPQGEQTFSFDLSRNIVIDAGFDTYIRTNWDQLDTPKDIELAVLGQKRLLQLTITRTGTADGVSFFSIVPKNWLVRLIVPELNLAYDEDRRLLRYEGLSNIPLEGVKNRPVDIQFDHFQSPDALAFPRSEWLPKAH